MFLNHFVPFTVAHHGSEGASLPCTRGIRAFAWSGTVPRSQPSMSLQKGGGECGVEGKGAEGGSASARAGGAFFANARLAIRAPNVERLPRLRGGKDDYLRADGGVRVRHRAHRVDRVCRRARDKDLAVGPRLVGNPLQRVKGVVDAVVPDPEAALGGARAPHVLPDAHVAQQLRKDERDELLRGVAVGRALKHGGRAAARGEKRRKVDVRGQLDAVAHGEKDCVCPHRERGGEHTKDEGGFHVNKELKWPLLRCLREILERVADLNPNKVRQELLLCKLPVVQSHFWVQF